MNTIIERLRNCKKYIEAVRLNQGKNEDFLEFKEACESDS